MNFPCGAADTSQLESKLCKYCGDPMDTTNKQRKYCSNKCRQADYRWRLKLRLDREHIDAECAEALGIPVWKEVPWYRKVWNWIANAKPFEP